MVVLDSALFSARRSSPPRLTAWMLIGLAAAAIGLSGMAMRGFSGSGLGFGTQLVWRFNCLVFFAALVAGPAGRLIPHLDFLADKSRPLLQGFCTGIGVYVGFIVLPSLFVVPGDVRAEGGATGMTIFVLFTAVVTLVLVGAVSRSLCERVGDKACRTMLGVAVGYFWLCYGLMGLAHISGPHRPDAFYELSVMLMVAGLLARFADSFFESRPPAPSA